MESMKYLNQKSGRLHFEISNNFYDVALLNWVHLFGHWDDDFHFRRILNDPDQFKAELLSTLGFQDPDWVSHWQNLKNFRDKIVAHSEFDARVTVPDLVVAFNAVNEYYKVVEKTIRKDFPGSRPDYLDLNEYVSYERPYYSESIKLVYQGLNSYVPKAKEAGQVDSHIEGDRDES